MFHCTLIHSLQYSWRATAIIFLAVASSIWVLIPAVTLVLGFIALRHYFLKTARDVKRLEAIGNCTQAHP